MGFIIIYLDGNNLSYKEFEDVVHSRVKIYLKDEAVAKIKSSYGYIQKILKEEKIAYGVNTGFGKFSECIISPEETGILQLNLLKSHACGVGEPLSESAVRGMMLLRINALAKGYSGISPDTLELLISILNAQIHPIVPSQGSLGASGDLAPLAHLALSLVGLGEVIYKGDRMPSRAALEQEGLHPIELQAKEGLALINGTQMMGSLLTLSVLEANKLLLAADIISAMSLEALSGRRDAFTPFAHEIRGHLGQINTAQNILKLTQNSERLKEIRVQDAYSLRCIPQVHGASKDSFNHVASVMKVELNAATDNPLVCSEIDQIISAGNFHGQPLALASDFLAIALSEIANISERRIERLVNNSLGGLPPFLSPNGGLNSGYMIMQYVAAALVSENKSLSHPASVDSIPSSANQEDHVSMGAIAARQCTQVVQNTYRVLAIEYLCAAQALEFGSGNMGPGTAMAYKKLRQVLPKLEEDREGSPEIEIATKILKGRIVSEIAEELDLVV